MLFNRMIFEKPYERRETKFSRTGSGRYEIWCDAPTDEQPMLWVTDGNVSGGKQIAERLPTENGRFVIDPDTEAKHAYSVEKYYFASTKHKGTVYLSKNCFIRRKYDI